jgi:hypothetical protein
LENPLRIQRRLTLVASDDFVLHREAVVVRNRTLYFTGSSRVRDSSTGFAYPPMQVAQISDAVGDCLLLSPINVFDYPELLIASGVPYRLLVQPSPTLPISDFTNKFEALGQQTNFKLSNLRTLNWELAQLDKLDPAMATLLSKSKLSDISTSTRQINELIIPDYGFPDYDKHDIVSISCNKDFQNVELSFSITDQLGKILSRRVINFNEQTELKNLNHSTWFSLTTQKDIAGTLTTSDYTSTFTLLSSTPFEMAIHPLDLLETANDQQWPAQSIIATYFSSEVEQFYSTEVSRTGQALD